jgi:AcrR family transcriptional regulator
MAKRTYRGTAQAEVAALTRRRIMETSLRLYETEWMEQVTLQRIAAEAGVTVQTILRHFGSKEGLMVAVAAVVREATVGERDAVPAGDIEAAVDYLIGHYEEIGDRMTRLLAQEQRYPLLKEILESGRSIHRAWVGRVFAPYLPSDAARERRVPQLTAICDVFVWKLLRRDMGLSVDAYHAALRDMLHALLM